jgi:hypothetical protein
MQLRDEQERRQAEAAAALDEKAKKRAARLEVHSTTRFHSCCNIARCDSHCT